MLNRVLLLASVLVSVLATACGLGVGAASAASTVSMAELVVTCLSCGERWVYLPPATLTAGCLSLFARRRKLNDECPKCHSRVVAFGHNGHSEPAQRRKTS